jgi:DNA-binding protein H-NS
VAAKYRGPNGETWSGRGLMPRWMATLVASGRTKEEFAIAS